MDKLEIDTKRNILSLNGAELENVKEIIVKIHDDDRTSVTVTLSPCEVDTHLHIGADGRNDWLGGL